MDVQGQVSAVREAGGAPPPVNGGITVCCILTSHNRRSSTVRCLELLDEEARSAGVSVRAVLVDDGSTDGTAKDVREKFDWVKVIVGDGTLFWARGMHLAATAADEVHFDHLLWLNDDTHLLRGGLRALISAASVAAASFDQGAIIVGAVRDPLSGRLTYGGGRRTCPRWRPFRYELLAPSGGLQPVDIMTGNVVLVSKSVCVALGKPDRAFEHAMADTDYALRATKNGIPIILTPQYVATCPRNDSAGTYRDPSLPMARRLRLMLDRKGLPWRSWLLLCRRHAGLLWPAHFVWPYIKLLTGARR